LFSAKYGMRLKIVDIQKQKLRHAMFSVRYMLKSEKWVNDLNITIQHG